MRFSLALLGISALALSACGPREDTAPSEPQATEPEATAPEAAPVEVSLYKLDCGTIQVSDLDVFSTEGDYAGQTDTFTDTCWLVRHPDGDLLWDLGLPGQLVGQQPFTDPPFTVSLEADLTTQLAEIGLTPADVEYISISHSHFDHTGQVGQFPGASWIVHEAEYNFMLPDPAEPGANAAWAALTATKFTGEYDVFGDGTVMIVDAVGHTPGHSVLMVTLPERGPIILVGDLYHRTESRELRRVPRFNWDVTNPPEGVEPGSLSLAAMDKVEALAEDTGARIVIQHEPDSVADLPDAPEAIR